MFARAAELLLGPELRSTLEFIGPDLTAEQLVELFAECLSLPHHAADLDGNGVVAWRQMSGAVQYDCEYLHIDGVAGEVAMNLTCGGYYPGALEIVDGEARVPITISSSSPESAARVEARVLEVLTLRGYRRR